MHILSACKGIIPHRIKKERSGNVWTTKPPEHSTHKPIFDRLAISIIPSFLEKCKPERKFYYEK